MGKRDTYFGILAKARIIVIAFGASVLLAITSAEANTLTVSDWQKMEAFGDALLSAQSDTLHAVTPQAASFDCMQFVYDIADTVYADVTKITTLVYLAALMNETSDEILVLEQLHGSLQGAKKGLPKWRKSMNSTMSRCAEFAIVTVKGQAALNLFSQADEQFTSLLNRIEPVLPSDFIKRFGMR
jgi:hypothetical protein